MLTDLTEIQRNLLAGLKKLPRFYRVGHKAGGLLKPGVLDSYDWRSLRGLFQKGYLKHHFHHEGVTGVEIVDLGARKRVFLKKDRKERFNCKRGWFVNAWRLVDENGKDCVQPWFNTKTEAREFAKSAGWIIDESNS